jgi:hypothetical protein
VTSTFAVELPIASALEFTKTLAPTTIFDEAFTVVDTNAVLFAETFTEELPTVILEAVTSTLAVELPMANALEFTKTLAPTVTLAEADTVVADTLPVTLPEIAVATTLPTNAVLLA